MGGSRWSTQGRGLRRRIGFAAVVFLALSGAAFAQARLLPEGFFDNVPSVGSSDVAVTANELTYQADTHQVLADGNVEVDYDGYQITGDHLVFDQRAHTAHFVGDVVVKAPDGTIYHAPDMQLSSGIHDALMRELTISTKEGGLVAAGNGDFRSGDTTILNDATYAPCGQCIDAKGHRIGWSAKATRMIYNHKTSTVTMENPTLYLLGIPVAWLPWLSMPDPSKRLTHLEMPSIDYSEQMGARVDVPYFIAAGEDTDIILTPALMSRQGLLVSGEVDQRFPTGTVRVRASAIYQRDPSAFMTNGVPEVGDRQWRGAMQVVGAFTPLPTWTVGWSYTKFTDANYFADYDISADKSTTNEVYATRLDGNEYIDVRLQQFNLLGNVTDASQNRQALALPNARYRNVLYLPQELGEVDLSADLLGVVRAADDPRGKVGGVPYNFGFEEHKVHGRAEVDWQKQVIAPGGIAVTPLVGLRADGAYYDGTSVLMPAAVDLLSATPIAALDVRYPLVARTGWATHVVEPIAQLVYRGSDTTTVGITNDDSQSFIFDDTNLFSLNRFAGIDRQETGLRANVGAHYQVTFDNGGWIDLLGGQSFQLAGTNAFAQPDLTQVTTGQGLSNSASYVVLGAQSSVIPGLTTAGKLQLDPADMQVTRGGLGGTWSIDHYILSLDYLYVAKNLARGVAKDRQEVSAGLSMPVPFVDYWSVDANGAWDVANNTWLAVGGGAHYDDGYLRYGADISATGRTNTSPNDLRFTASFFLKGLGGMSF